MYIVLCKHKNRSTFHPGWTFIGNRLSAKCMPHLTFYGNKSYFGQSFASKQVSLLKGWLDYHWKAVKPNWYILGIFPGWTFIGNRLSAKRVPHLLSMVTLSSDFLITKFQAIYASYLKHSGYFYVNEILRYMSFGNP